jgi:hypothetical protein
MSMYYRSGWSEIMFQYLKALICTCKYFDDKYVINLYKFSLYLLLVSL